MERIIEYSEIDSIECSYEGDTSIAIEYSSQNNEYHLIYKKLHYEITKNEVDELLKTLQNLKIDKLPELGMGLDGKTYILKLLSGWNSVKFEWWSDTCGSHWQDLFTFREKIKKLKEKHTKR
ncbi:MAG: hypothetical protein PHW92_12915 [Lutibacter sp.]|jgi:hypothetical protein|nr:hypothetical protein [Lutibacter sp.]